MGKRKKGKKKKKSSAKQKSRSDRPVDVEKAKSSDPGGPSNPVRNHSILLRLAADSRNVGALKWMLRGCLACGGFIGVLFTFSELGRLYEGIAYRIISLLPKGSIPPDTYVPGALAPFFLFILVAVFTIHGYLKGETPPKIETDKDIRKLREKLFEFAFFFVITFVIIFLRIREDHPAIGLTEIISDPYYIILFIILLLGMLFYVFSRHQSPQFLIFIMSSALAVAFVFFLLGLMLKIVIDFTFHILNNWNSF